MGKDSLAFLYSQKQKLLKALSHLTYSYQKIQKLSADPKQLDEETLETWESFVARFSRVVDLFLMRYLRTRILYEDPGFSGSLRDFVNQGEKLGLLQDTERWMALRELRNISAHEYTDQDLESFFQRLRKECNWLLSLESLLEDI